MAKTNQLDLLRLGNAAYDENWPDNFEFIQGNDQPSGSGLEIYALRNKTTDEVTFAVRGSERNSPEDWGVPGGANFSHVSQFQNG